MAKEETIEVRTGEQFALELVEDYLRRHIAGLPAAPLQVRQFPSGASNLTYLLRIDQWEAVLRRPPLGPIPPKAHDMERESNLLRSVYPLFPLAPEPLLFCNDTAIIGAPFYVMERRKGLLFNNRFPAAITPTRTLCTRISQAFIETLVHIHTLDWQSTGLNSLGHPTGFLERQVQSWVERYRRAQTADIPEAEPLMQWLLAHVPMSPPPTLIHNDFKLNNLLFNEQDPTRVVAVLDWEMATIGDPLLDLAVALSYWVQDDDPAQLKAIQPTVTAQPEFLRREQLIEMYARQSERDLTLLPFYMVVAYFKLAVILQQIYIRWQRGQTRDERFAIFAVHAHSLIAHASQLAEQHG